ncbi:hypothetical protein HNY73_019859 [Argiope bruennichi]|uniref:Uncharacterized protein n=1 Tax=Argiope bruennichi TaxID=94029 RepID=A0A8T0E5S0_ARGBR|nr:hypothetical protein HNY73_019859 [Argiope bruennichi]
MSRQKLLKKENSSGNRTVSQLLKGKYVMIHVTSLTRPSGISTTPGPAFNIFNQISNESASGRRPIINGSKIKKRNPSFGTALLLITDPMTPKSMNASYDVASVERRKAIDEFLARMAHGQLLARIPAVLQRS